MYNYLNIILLLCCTFYRIHSTELTIVNQIQVRDSITLFIQLNGTDGALLESPVSILFNNHTYNSSDVVMDHPDRGYVKNVVNPKSKNGPLQIISPMKSNVIDIQLLPIIFNFTGAVSPTVSTLIKIEGDFLNNNRFNGSSTLLEIKDIDGKSVCKSITVEGSIYCDHIPSEMPSTITISIDKQISQGILIPCPSCQTTPILKSLESNGPILTSGGATITLIGTFFKIYNSSDIIVKVNAIPCTGVKSLDRSRIVFTLPPGSGTNNIISLMLSSEEIQGTVKLTYSEPTISSAQYSVEEKLVIITGTSHSSTNCSVILTGDNLICTVLDVIDYSITRCILPQMDRDYTRQIPFLLVVNGQSAQGSFMLPMVPYSPSSSETNSKPAFSVSPTVLVAIYLPIGGVFLIGVVVYSIIRYRNNKKRSEKLQILENTQPTPGE
ncbi:IPT/TIG domain-containing protein [Tieghemostelium lacteum]|uniref:IPT/TIG domain-containing protein n=1 Tax=Tieghemostelium lacteum TaxID=361077 RepID=A0A152A9Y0_TIELA|nr:IPT/TIG domain-containing protein [Tieghemostelium lacteum]|eukprot:KYR03029.1 IPT/TIG domain-containing protein [Tieghemostelium lacteum]